MELEAQKIELEVQKMELEAAERKQKMEIAVTESQAAIKEMETMTQILMVMLNNLSLCVSTYLSLFWCTVRTWHEPIFKTV
jgi:hypothetical protein